MQIVLVEFGITQRRRFSVDGMFLTAYVGRTENPQPLVVGSHYSVLNSVVHHLHKMAGSIWPTMQISLFRRANSFFAARSAWDVANARSERGENGIEVLNDIVFAANHHAVTAFQAPNPAAGAHIRIVNLQFC